MVHINDDNQDVLRYTGSAIKISLLVIIIR